VVYIANLSTNPINVKMEMSGKFTNYMTGKEMELTANQATNLFPFQYYILTE